jgi:tRNA-modifying protein YgfZ
VRPASFAIDSSVGTGTSVGAGMAVSVPELALYDTAYTMTTHSPGCLLDDLGVIRFRGADTRLFLQGQLSNDIERLSPDTLLRASVNTPQGRTLALMGLIASDSDVLALMPRDLIASISTLLKRYVLRSKVTLTDDSAAFRIVGLQATDVTAAGLQRGQLCRYGLQADQRLVLLQPVTTHADVTFEMAREHWRALDIAAGLPYVASALSGEFVAQMLNLDCIDAISFNKGCYTGQEVIARAHYRGRVKRRMQRFVADVATGFDRGVSGHLQDGRAFRVIDAVTRADGRCEFLAVAPLAGAVQEAVPESAPESAPGSQTDRGERLTAQSLPLPYPIPD